MRRFLERAAPLLNIGLEGDPAVGSAADAYFALRPLKAGALDAVWPALEAYPEPQRTRLTVYRERAGKDDKAVFVRPGEAVFDRLAALFMARFGPAVLKGSTFIDPLADAPYLFHLAPVQVRQGDTQAVESTAAANSTVIESRLVGLRQPATGEMAVAPVEHLLLRGGPPAYGPYLSLVARSDKLREAARAYLHDQVAHEMADARRQAVLSDLPERLDAVRLGFDLREAELAERRTCYNAKIQDGDPQLVARAQAELTRVKQQQREMALAALECEPEGIAPGEVVFLAHALVMPSDAPEDKQAFHQETERVAMGQAMAYEQSLGATVRNVSTPLLAMEAGLEAYPGFDLLSYRPGGEIRQIEVKGRAGTSGQVELSYNEWIKACNGQDDYWLYAVYGCATPAPALLRVQNPFKKQLGGQKGSWVIDQSEIVQAAESD